MFLNLVNFGNNHVTPGLVCVLGNHVTFAWNSQLTLIVTREETYFYWKTVNFVLLLSLKLPKDLMHMDCCV